MSEKLCTLRKHGGGNVSFDEFDVVITATLSSTSSITASITYKGQTQTLSASGSSSTVTRTLTIGAYTFVVSAWSYGASFTTQDYQLNPIIQAGSSTFRKEVSLALTKTPNGHDAIGIY